MEFTAPTPISRGLVALCSTRTLLASANGNILQLHDVAQGVLVRELTTAGPLSHLAWSADSAPPLLAAASTPGGNVVVVDAAGDVVADVHDGRLESAWLAVCAAPRRLLLGYEHSLGTAVYDLGRGMLLRFFPNLVAAAVGRAAGMRVVSSCGRFAALAVITAPQAYPSGVAVVSMRDASVVASVSQPGGIVRLAALRWLGGGVLAWGRRKNSPMDSSLTHLSVHGHVVSSGPFHGCTGDLGVNFVATECPSGIMTVGYTDGSMSIVDLVMWRLVKQFSHLSPEIVDTAPPTIFRERRSSVSRSGSNTAAEYRDASRKSGDVEIRSVFEVIECSENIDIGQGRRWDGVSHGKHGADARDRVRVLWTGASHDGAYVASRSEASGHVVLIWEVRTVRLAAVVVLMEEVLSARWTTSTGSGGVPKLAIVCGGPWVYLWEERGVAAVRVDMVGETGPRFGARRIVWTHDDSALVVVDGLSANAFVTLFVT